MDRTPAINLPPVVLWLAAAFIAVHVVRQFLSPDLDEWVLLDLRLPAGALRRGRGAAAGRGGRALLDAGHLRLPACRLPASLRQHHLDGELRRAARPPLRQRALSALGLVAAVAGAGLHYALHPATQALVIGASGAVSGMMAATARFAFSPGGPLAGGRTERRSRFRRSRSLSVVRNGRAVAFILIWFVVNLVFGLRGGLVAGRLRADRLGGAYRRLPCGTPAFSAARSRRPPAPARRWPHSGRLPKLGIEFPEGSRAKGRIR